MELAKRVGIRQLSVYLSNCPAVELLSCPVHLLICPPARASHSPWGQTVPTTCNVEAAPEANTVYCLCGQEGRVGVTERERERERERKRES